MLPIVANIVANDHKHSAKHGFMLSAAYGVGVATAYGMLGAVVAVFGRQYIIQAMQNPVVLLVCAGIFVLLALYLLDIIKIRLPFAISQKLHQLSEKGQGNLGGVLGSAVAGFFSAIVVSPCVTAPLVGALIGVASVGDPVFGFIALFMLGLGLSTPLIIIGTTEGKFIPKAGTWMDWVKQGFALLLFAVAIMLVARVFNASWELALWGALAAAFAYWFWQYAGKGRIIARIATVLLGIWAVLLVVGAFLGNIDPLKPLTSKPLPIEKHHPQANVPKQTFAKRTVQKIYTLAQLNQLAKRHPNMIVDVWASWCIECKHMEAALFREPPAEMANWELVKLDITQATDDSKAAMEALELFGPPALAFYKDGKLIGVKHGMTKRKEFIHMLNELNKD